MLTRTPPYQPWTRSSAADEAFAAEVEMILAASRAQRRARLAADRASFWERATSDVQWDHDNERWNNGEGEV